MANSPQTLPTLTHTRGRARTSMHVCTHTHTHTHTGVVVVSGLHQQARTSTPGRWGGQSLLYMIMATYEHGMPDVTGQSESTDKVQLNKNDAAMICCSYKLL